MSAAKTPRGLALLALVMLLWATGCGGGDAPQNPTGPPDPPDPPIPQSIFECEREGYPCSLSAVSIEVLELSDALGDSVLAMWKSGASTAQTATWLNGQTGMAEVESDDLAVRFRLEGGRGTWILREGVFAEIDTTGASPLSSPPARVAPPPGRPLKDIVGGDTEEKRALVLSVTLWHMDTFDDGAAVEGILLGTRGYENRVKFLANAEMTSSEVTLEDFRSWRNYDVVHVSTHGKRLCNAAGCRATIVYATVSGALPGSGTEAERIHSLKQQGIETAKSEEFPGTTYLSLTADFFRKEYGSGLDKTIVFLNACQSYGSQATDLVEAIQGTTSVVFGWDHAVYAGEATAAAVALYEELSEGGYPAEIAYKRVDESLKTGSPTSHGPSPRLRMGERTDGDDLRIRDVVFLLNPASGQMLTTSTNVQIEGTQGDGTPDAAPFLVQVDGVEQQYAPDMHVFVSVDGVEADPLAVSSGEVNEKNQWMVRGSVPLGYDLEEDRAVTFKARVTLHSGGESDDETGATLTGGEPIMGYEWQMEARHVTSYSGIPHSPYDATASLTLTFADGQAVDEPNPRYVVTGGTVTYSYSHTYFDCTYTAAPITFDVTPEIAGNSALTFHTSANPVTFTGYIWTRGPEFSVLESCSGGDGHTRTHRASTMWFNYDSDESQPVSADHTTITRSPAHTAR